VAAIVSYFICGLTSSSLAIVAVIAVVVARAIPSGLLLLFWPSSQPNVWLFYERT